MKKIIIILIMSFTAQLSFGQKIERNVTDEFTGIAIKETSWERFSKAESLYSYARFKKIEEQYYFELKVSLAYGPVFSVNKGADIFIKFSDDSILKLYNYDYQISSHGGGAIGLAGSAAQGAKLSCSINNKSLEILEKKSIVKVRIYTTDGFAESKVTLKYAKKINQLAKLIKL